MLGNAEDGAPEVTLETSMGSVTVELYNKHAPRTCRNFIELSRRGKYDNVKFHRIIKIVVVVGEEVGFYRTRRRSYGYRERWRIDIWVTSVRLALPWRLIEVSNR
ncbi:hypothetical protein GIB67_012749 [Kingdonia uniflora]|uniref:peptidylprolyl isomerase n=1 Tax=Kingdonia uniflora TaxID=39325 RepID=A0A7J7NFU1_9MAGN|nr:hypothetical protein GIB67_012749 [Kingdonia uniflora]